MLVLVVTHADFVHTEQRLLDGAELTVVQSALQHTAHLLTLQSTEVPSFEHFQE